MYDVLNRAVAAIIIRGVSERHPKMSERKTVNLFLGYLGARDNREIRNDEFFGSLHFISRPAMIRIIRRMIALNLLKLTMKGKVPLIDVTSVGLEFQANDKSAYVDVLYGHVVIQNGLYYDLEMTRRAIAIEKHIPEDAICDDHVLEILSKKKPTSLEAMRELKGVPGGFIYGYGNRFLKDITKHLGSDIVS